jgi:hypothetical protein
VLGDGIPKPGQTKRVLSMRKYSTLILAVIIVALIHEGSHALIASLYGEYETFLIHPYGLEVVFQTPVAEREGIKWGLISGTSNVVTISLGYLLFLLRSKIARSQSQFIIATGYWLTILLLLVDAFNLSIGPFIYGGDVKGIAIGFGISQHLIQVVFLAILLLNRGLIASRLLPEYGVKTTHPLFRRWS